MSTPKPAADGPANVDAMPELHNVQAYLSLRKRSFPDALEMFSEVLDGLGLGDEPVRRWLQTLRWTPADDGFVYPSAQPWVSTSVDGTALAVAPHVLGWTPRVIERLDANWLQVGLLLKTDDISLSSPDDWRYRSGLERPLYHLVRSFLAISVDAPTYLTDELQDGKPWEAWVGAGGDPWAFDLAVASNGIGWPPAPLPAGFSEARLTNGLAVSRDVIWQAQPWRE